VEARAFGMGLTRGFSCQLTTKIIGFDHGVGHPLLLLCNAKAHNCRNNKSLEWLWHYFEWPKVADAVIEARFSSVKYTDIATTFSIVKSLFWGVSSNIFTFVSGYDGFRTFVRMDRSGAGANRAQCVPPANAPAETG